MSVRQQHYSEQSRPVAEAPSPTRHDWSGPADNAGPPMFVIMTSDIEPDQQSREHGAMTEC